MRVAKGFWGSALVLIGASAVGVLGLWALGAGAALLLLAAVVGTTAMESRDLNVRRSAETGPYSSVLRQAE
jgi:uncharacterized membrane protein